MFQRTLAQSIKSLNEHFPVLLLTGPRQVGKTTLFDLCKDDTRGYVSLDDLTARTLAQLDPALFFQTYPPPIIIDEVQYAPQLFSQIKLIADKLKQNGLFWLTGSQKFHLMKGITESLAGRVAILDLLGLSQAELQHRAYNNQPFKPDLSLLKTTNTYSTMSQLKDTYKNIWLGSFPRVHESDGKIRDIFYRSYIQTYIQRDVKDILNITDENTFYTFLVTIASRTGQLLNYSALGRDIGIDNKTVKAWLSVLETSGLIYLLHPYHNNISKRLVKAPKLYFLDTGLCTYLTKWPTPESLEAGSMSGAILETYLFSEILKSYWHNGVEPYFYFYRDMDQKEIDLIIETADTVHPIEFKKTATPLLSATKNFHLLNKLGKKVGCGAVICFINYPILLSQEIIAIPVQQL